MKKEEEWLLKEKYHGERSAPVFNESPEEIKNKYSWGEDFFNDCARLRNGEPLAYLIGYVPFLGTTIHLNSHPLIPRPETEYWVDHILKTFIPHRRDLTPTMRILDMCAGSGCIGVAFLHAEKEAYVDFAEIDIVHHATIRKNIEVNDLDSSHTHIIGGDLFENIHGVYDYILSNPPYIDPAVDRTEPSVRMHEPHQALYGGTNGLDLIFRIIERAPVYLADRGILVIEHEPEQVSAINEKAKECNLFPTSYRDQYNVHRYTVFTRSKDEIVSPY